MAGHLEGRVEWCPERSRDSKQVEGHPPMPFPVPAACPRTKSYPINSLAFRKRHLEATRLHNVSTPGLVAALAS